MPNKNSFRLLTRGNQPLLTVSIIRNQKYIDLRYEAHKFKLVDLNGHDLLEGSDAPTKEMSWRIKLKQGQPASYEYFLILRESAHREVAQHALAEFEKYSENVLLRKRGGRVYLGESDSPVSDSQKYAVLAGPFESEREARHHSKKYGQLNHCRIHRRRVKEGKGLIELYDQTMDHFLECRDGLLLQSLRDKAYFTIEHNRITHRQIPRSRQKNLHYQGDLHIFIDEEEGLSALNEVPMDSYLKGVLASEADENNAIEFIRTMAIVARSQIFARFKQKHFDECFDFCSDSHCLRYYGNKENNLQIDRAIADTSGQVLSCRGKICDAWFSYSCGGHTENPAEVWQSDSCEYTSGKYDGQPPSGQQYNLHNEEDVKEWILSRPPVYCHVDSDELAGSKELRSDSFRWEVFYTRTELEEIMREKTGEDVGIIYEIIPLKRGVSGRIKEIQILGSLKNVVVSGELNIRSAFSENFLNSSCFIVKPETDQDGVPLNFLFIGAGMGHGVGLCKVGASKMALNGSGHDEILNHYFDKCTTRKIF